MKNGRVVINRKICDNAPECSGIEVCPTSALYWDDDHQKVSFDESICMDCGMCADVCPVGAILWGEDDQDYYQKQEEVDKDPRTFEELSVERYGAVPIENPISLEDVRDFIDNAESQYALIEYFNDSSINCLLHSIRIEDIKKWFGESVIYRKTQLPDEANLSDYGITALPALSIHRDGQLIGTISGYYDDKDISQNLLKTQVQEILSR